MKKFKYLLSAALFSLILIAYGAEQNPRKRKLSEKEIVGLDEEVNENEKKQKSEFIARLCLLIFIRKLKKTCFRRAKQKINNRCN